MSTLLPGRITELFTTADVIQISAVSLYEIRQKVRIGKWREMEPHGERLIDILSQQGIVIVEISAEISDMAGSLAWGHRDPFDRMIAATAIQLQVPLISADIAFDELSNRADWPGRIW